jgi:hypothetical protein
MNDHDIPAGGLAGALTQLADTMPDDPYRLEGVHARVRRLRARRLTRRVAVSALAAVAAVTSLAAVRSGHDRIATAPLAKPPTESTLPACHAALAAAQATPSTVPTDRRGTKGYGTIVGTPTETSVTIHVDEPAPDQPSELAATFVDQTVFADAGVNGPKPALAPGDRVVFAAEEVDGGYQLLLIEVHPVEGPKPTTQDVTDAKKAQAAQTGEKESRELKASAEVVSVQSGSITLKVSDGPQAGHVIDVATGSDTSFLAAGTKCNGTDLVAGDALRVVLTDGVDGTYTAAAVILSD